MEGEKIYPASPHKIKKSREEGQVAKSTDLVGLIVLIVSFVYIYLSKDKILGLMDELLLMLSNDIHKEFNVYMFGEYIKEIMFAVLPLFLCILIGAILANYFQVGWMLSPKALAPKLERINPLSGFKRIFSKDGLVQLAKSLVKVVGAVWIAYSEVSKLVQSMNQVYTENMPLAWTMLFKNLFSISMKICGLLFVISVIDYAYKKFKFLNDLKMTKQEMTEEYKKLEGNPLIKQRQREFGRMLTKRQIQKVKEATVVITNPTHFAVAIKYDPITQPIPMVLFKGVDDIAQNAKKIAKENNIPIVENIPLARALYAKVDEGSVIPREFFDSVSEVIHHIMIMDKKFGKKIEKQIQKRR